jgi:hypothetical protein
MAAFLDNCRFNPTLGGTTDWTFSSAVTGYQSPSAAGVVNGRVYEYFAISASGTEWEIGRGAYNTGTGVLARTTVLYNSSATGTATGQSGAGTKITFSAAPQVAVVAIKESLISVEEANSFTSTQQGQARDNILAAKSSSGWTRQVFTSGSGTYTTPAGCKAILVKLKGAGSGSAGSGSAGGTGGGAGGATTFNAGAITAPGGQATTVLSFTGGLGGAVGVGGDFSIAGGDGDNANAAIAFGNAGKGAGAGGGKAASPNVANNTAGKANSGGGGGGPASASGVGAVGGGAEGAYTEKLIVSPSASYTYAVGAAGTAGAAGTSGFAGMPGGSGIIIVEEYY